MSKVGLLGAGRIATVHARAIAAHPQSELIAVADVIADNARKLTAEQGGAVRDAKEIIAVPSIDAVLIATPTYTHSNYIEAARKAGKAVLCEKPVDLCLERARACKKAVASTGQLVMIGFNRRFDPNFGALKAALDAGEAAARSAPTTALGRSAAISTGSPGPRNC